MEMMSNSSSAGVQLEPGSTTIYADVLCKLGAGPELRGEMETCSSTLQQVF